MGLHTETEGILGSEERKFLSARNEEEVLPVRNAATELAASLTWLPDRDASDNPLGSGSINSGPLSAAGLNVFAFEFNTHEAAA